jgi:hypothetical protein
VVVIALIPQEPAENFVFLWWNIDSVWTSKIYEGMCDSSFKIMYLFFMFYLSS